MTHVCVDDLMIPPQPQQPLPSGRHLYDGGQVREGNLCVPAEPEVGTGG